MPALPPWLDITPAQFGQAASEGAHINLERAQLQQSAAQAAARLGLEQKRLEDSEQQTALANQIHQQQIAANFQRAQTQTAMTQAYRQAMIGLGKQRLQETATKTAQAHQAAASMLTQKQQVAAYKTAHPDATTADLMSQFPAVPPNYIAELNKTSSGTTVTFTRHSDSPEQAAKPATTSTIPFLTRLGFPTGITPGTPYQPGKAKGTLTETVKAPIGTSPADAFRAAQPPGAPAPGTAPPPAVAASNLPKVGDVVNGYTFKGGDPSDEKSWEQVAATK